MAGSVVVEQQSVSVVPGEMGTCTVRIRNTGTVVDQFSLTVLGQPAAWTTVVPAALSLFPGADGTIELHFAPPRAPGVGQGATPFGVRVVGSEDPDNPVVEEGEVVLQPFVDVTAKVTPRTSETKRKARHDVVLDNKGNAPVVVALSATDPDEQLAFELKDREVTVEAGQSLHVALKVAAKKGFARGSDKHRPFQVTARPEGSGYPLVMDANLIQKAGLPRFVFPLIAGAVALALIVAVLPAMLNKDAKGNLQLTSDEGEVTTTVAPAVEEDAGAGEDGPATPEEAAAAAAAELAANGKDPDGTTAGGGTSGGGDGDTSAAGSGSGSTAGSGSTDSGSTSDGETTVTSPSATTAPPPGSGGSTATTTAGGTTATTTATASNSSTTTTQPTTTTATPTWKSFLGRWVSGSNTVDIASSDGVNLSVITVTNGTKSSWTNGTTNDANDGSFTVFLGKTTGTISLIRGGINFQTTPPAGFCCATTANYVRG